MIVPVSKSESLVASLAFTLLFTKLVDLKPSQNKALNGDFPIWCLHILIIYDYIKIAIV